MRIERCILGLALLCGCSTGPTRGPGPNATRQTDPTQGADTGALASDSTSPSTAWPNTRPAPPPTAQPRTQYARTRPAAHDPDTEITRQIGAAVLEDDALTGARNVVISTHEGVVTLRGNVATPRDAERIDADAYAVPGVYRVENLLEVGE
jgi:hypothetical protein